jgi:uncharacterized protein YkwD
MPIHAWLVCPSSIRLAALALIAAALVGCSAEAPKTTEAPTFYRSMAEHGASVDANAAASMISGYRSNNGLSGVAVDAELMRAADAQAKAMAAKNKVDQNIAGPFKERIRRSGFDAATAAENVSAGYHTLAEAFSGWRDSPPHRSNMLLKGATKMGIAAVYVPGSKYKVFWSLILAAPDQPRG